MLNPDQLKPHLLHEDRWVRLSVTGYFSDCCSRDSEVARLVLASHDRYYRKGEFPLLGCLQDIFLDDAASGRVLDLIEASPSHITAIQLNWAVAALPLQYIRQNSERIERNSAVSEEARTCIAHRREVAELSDEELWRRLVDFSGRDRMRRSPVRDDGGLADALTEELASRESPDEEVICKMLDSRTYAGTFFDGLVVKLAGAKRSRRAVPHIVRRLSAESEEDDFSTFYEQKALARIGDPVTVRLIRERWRGYSRDNRMDAACVLGRIKLPESERALLDFFKTETESDVRYYLAEALCELFSREGVAFVLQSIREGSPYEPLEKKFLPCLDVLGIDHLPQAKAWRKARAEHFDRHPLRDEPDPEADLLHRKLMECVVMEDMAREGIQMIYGELGRRLAESEEE